MYDNLEQQNSTYIKMTYEENNQYDVKVINAFKGYGGNDVIKGLDMNIKSGCIYGLLGPSGCGKSTLLQCILGLIPLDTGRIDLKADSLRDIGYMPQDLCLDGTLTVGESLNYYGSLYNMNKKQVKSRIEQLSAFLQLPNMDSYIEDISGGQCRRVSLAISLLHDPEIIILDEPTVGIDPLLRHEIWEEFTRMVQEHKKTIIITTHYIEEASQAHFVGLMRNGKLVEEGTPADILSKYNAETLESAFLSLCFDRETNQIIHNHVPIDNVNKIKYSKPQTKNLKKLEKQIEFVRIKALLRKNIRVFLRDYYLIFTMFILPILQAYNLCTGIGVEMRDLSIAVANDEIDYSNCKYSNLDGCIIDNNNNQTLSCVVMDYFLSQNYKLVHVNDRDDGEMILKDSNYVAFIHFPKNYTKELIKFIDDRERYDINTQAYIHFTKHNAIIKNQFVSNMMDTMEHLMNEISISCSNNQKSLQIPLEFNTVVGMEVKSYSSSLVPIFIAMAALYFTSIFSVSVMLSERMDGILSRSMFAGVTVLELLISMFCIITMTLVLQLTIPLLMVYVFYAHPLIISSGIIVYFSLIIFLGWIGFLVGILIAGLLPSRVGAVYAINGWIMSQFLLSGGIWPVEGQSKLLRLITETLPMRIAGKTMSDITLKGWAIDNPSVIMGTSMTIAYTVGLILILIVLGKIKKDMWVIHK